MIFRVGCGACTATVMFTCQSMEAAVLEGTGEHHHDRRHIIHHMELIRCYLMELLYIELSFGIDQVLLLSTLKARSRPPRLFKVPGDVNQSDADDDEGDNDGDLSK